MTSISPRFDLIVIGCSLGGMRALETILGALPAEFETPIAIVQHRYRTSNEMLPAFFRRTTKLRVVDADDKAWIRSGHVYFAPANYHLLVAEGEFSLSVDEAVAAGKISLAPAQGDEESYCYVIPHQARIECSLTTDGDVEISGARPAVDPLTHRAKKVL